MNYLTVFGENLYLCNKFNIKCGAMEQLLHYMLLLQKVGDSQSFDCERRRPCIYQRLEALASFLSLFCTSYLLNFDAKVQHFRENML